MLLLNLFQAIVFCEPDLRSLSNLSEFLELISENSSSYICNRFCINETSNVMSMQRFKILRFSIETCPLQVFSCLLQISFMSYQSDQLTLDHSNEVITVTNITIRMIKFLRNCFDRREYLNSNILSLREIVIINWKCISGVDWLFRKSGSPDDTQSTQVSYCYCYVVSCIIVLLHFCINSWMENHKIIGMIPCKSADFNDVNDFISIDLKMMKTIFAMGTLFLFDIIKKHYEPKVLSLGGFPVKNRLQAIYDWIMYYCPFRIHSSISENAIKSVNLRRILQLNEPQMVLPDMQPPTSDQADSILLDSFDVLLL